MRKRLFGEMKNLTLPKLLIINKASCLESEMAGASLVFQVVSQNQERCGAIFLTGNKAISAWCEVLAGNAVIAFTTLKQLFHHCAIVNFRGKS